MNIFSKKHIIFLFALVAAFYFFAMPGRVFASSYGAVGFRTATAVDVTQDDLDSSGFGGVDLMVYPTWCPAGEGNVAILQRTLINNGASTQWRYFRALRTKTSPGFSQSIYRWQGDGTSSSPIGIDALGDSAWDDGNWVGGPGAPDERDRVAYNGALPGWAAFAPIREMRSDYRWTIRIYQSVGGSLKYQTNDGSLFAEFLFNTSCNFHVKFKNKDQNMYYGPNTYAPDRQIIDFWDYCQANKYNPSISDLGNCKGLNYAMYDRERAYGGNASKDFALSYRHEDYSYEVSFDGYADSGAKTLAMGLKARNDCYTAEKIQCYTNVFARIHGNFDHMGFWGQISKDASGKYEIFLKNPDGSRGTQVDYDPNSGKKLLPNTAYLIGFDLKIDCEAAEYRSASGSPNCKHGSNNRDVGNDPLAIKNRLNAAPADGAWWPLDDAVNNQDNHSNQLNFYYKNSPFGSTNVLEEQCSITKTCPAPADNIDGPDGPIASSKVDPYYRYRTTTSDKIALLDINADDDDTCQTVAECFDSSASNNHYRLGDMFRITDVTVTTGSSSNQRFGIVANHGLGIDNAGLFPGHNFDASWSSEYVVFDLAVMSSPVSCTVTPSSGDAPLATTMSISGFPAGTTFNWDFGDGTVPSNQGASVNHSFKSQPASTPTATPSSGGSAIFCPVTVTMPKSGSQKEVAP